MVRISVCFLYKVTIQCLLIHIAQARQTVNRKRFLGEHERTVNGLACLLDAVK
ncbi:MAG: hypothetical protein FWC60_08895 [Firmicutes bacterium]|nr:hypothetical protein [Bacillota bacterium]